MWFAYGSESVLIIKPVLAHSRASYKLLTAQTWPLSVIQIRATPGPSLQYVGRGKSGCVDQSWARK